MKKEVSGNKTLSWNSDEVYNWANTHEQDNVRNNAELLKTQNCSSQRLLDPNIINDLMELKISKFAAKDIHDAMKQKFNDFNHQSSGPAAIFWDIENAIVPKRMKLRTAVNLIRKKVEKFGVLKSFNIVGELEYLSAEETQDLQFSGCSVINTPHLKKEEVADKAIIANILLFALDHPHPASIIVITGDADFAFVLTKLKDRGYRTVLVYTNSVKEDSRKGELLLNSSSERLSWELDILGQSYNDFAKNVVPQSGEDKESFNLFFDLTSAIFNISPIDGKARKSMVANKLIELNPDIYKRDAFANQNIINFRSYVKAAKDLGLVEEGGEKGNAWVQIVRAENPNYENW